MESKLVKNKLYENLNNLRLRNGLYIASTGSQYQKVWIRDTFYCVLPELKRNPSQYKQTMETLLDYYKHMEQKYQKFSWLIREPHPKVGYRYLHPRMTFDLDEINEEWGFKQNDCFGEFLYGLYLGEKEGLNIIKDEYDRHIINLMITTLEAIKYWKDKDNGIWEENEEVHASSIGACLRGLISIKKLGFNVSDKLIEEGYKALNELLPRESVTKNTDLALLTLIYPFNIVSEDMAYKIINDVEKHLLRERGVIRYINDMYYNSDYKNLYSNEAEWCFGFSFLALSYNLLNNKERAKYYLKEIEKTYIDGNIPELFYSKSNFPNENNPLGWSLSLAILALDEI